MTRTDLLRAEFQRETQTARKHLERLPDDRLDWRPHPKSFTAGQLGSHLVDCIRWAGQVFGADELDLDPRTYRPFDAPSVPLLLEGFDAEVAKGVAAMANCADGGAEQPWRLKMNGKVWFTKPREAAFRDLALSHMVHHRGQLSVYLRLLEVRVPGSYGPTADDAGGPNAR